jgi:hypothetical protein
MSDYFATPDGIFAEYTVFHGTSHYNYNQNIVNSYAYNCTYKGQNLPIYQIFRDYYGSEKADTDCVKMTGGAYFGIVLSFANEDNNDGYILSWFYAGDFPDLATRREEIQSGRMQSSRNVLQLLKVKLSATPSASEQTSFKFWRNNIRTTQNNVQMLAEINWQDGVGTVLGPTLCYPFILVDDTNSVVTGLTTMTFQQSFLGACSFDDILVSEDPEDRIAIARTYSAQRTGYDHSGTIEYLTYLCGLTPPPPPPEYPFEDDSNEGGGGTGDYRDTSDTIPIDGTPTNSAIASGFVNAYLLTQQNVDDFHAYLYSTDFLDNVKKLMNDPIDYILAFMLAPYTPDTSAAAHITIGGTDSEVAATRISSGYKTLDCGTITLKEFWGKFYDYNPYTKVQIYLPFIGMRPLDVDDVMAGDVNLKYRIDVLTGACVATISVNNARGENGAVYSFNGNCHSHIPVSGKNYLETVTNVISAGVGMAGSIASGNALGVATGAINVMRSAKEQLEHAGELTGAAGLLANYTPFLMVSRPSQSLAANYNHYKGFISNVTRTLGDLSGFTQVAELVQTNIHCTLDEFDEINELLKEGVYL